MKNSTDALLLDLSGDSRIASTDVGRDWVGLGNMITDFSGDSRIASTDVGRDWVGLGNMITDLSGDSRIASTDIRLLAKFFKAPLLKGGWGDQSGILPEVYWVGSGKNYLNLRKLIVIKFPELG